MTKGKEKSKARVFADRLLSTVILWAIVTAVFLSDQPVAFAVMVVALSMLALKEYYTMVRDGGLSAQPKIGMVSALIYLGAISYLLVNSGGAALDRVGQLDAIAVSFVAMASFLWQLRQSVEKHKTLNEVALTLLGFIYIPVMFSFVLRLLFLPEGESMVPGAVLILWLVAVTKFTDMGAYVTGSLIGKNKMIPHISPAKTWEGIAGGVFFAQLAGCGLFYFFPEQLEVLGGWPQVIGFVFVLAFLAVVGDLAESVVKRALEIKDSGHTLPGIGGVLDLIDSICFTAPALYFLIIWL